ncbi:MAG: GFA family protein [Alphaproteobacteria bacterium]|jgi:hypothetical protein|nr:GFA family protein [Rhodospirillaceae bacterium]MBT6511406.1 GFA family protein [Rhodospirillaceae bacterium]MBT7614029.1 GFA family protein [Rhodospirillaceae bacterium]MBT7645523.1 GFA family protein [Rhodospirillaceae bacterium]MDG2482487.1 GFA family protein [Alphaproteobacteria bacterium]
MPQEHKGGCLCGDIRYQVSSDPLVQCYCCCETCQGASGAPAVSWIAVRESGFEITAGKPVAYGSSPDVIREFCGHCGTALTYRNHGYPDDRFREALVAVTSVSLDNIEAFPPTELFHDNELPDWLPAEQLCPGAKRHHPKVGDHGQP